MAGPAALLGLLGTGASRLSPYIPRLLKKGGYKKTGQYADVATKDLPISYGRTGAAAGVLGLLANEMITPDAEESQVTTGGQGIDPRMDLIRGRTPMADNWSPPGDLESRLDYLQRRKAEDAAVIKKVLLQGAILKAHNPRSKDTYTKDALEFIKADALAKNNMQQARIIEAIKNKDGTLPDDSKVIYDRIIRAGGDPAYASEISGHQQAIEKTQAEAAADYMRGQPKLTDRYSKDQLMMMELKQAYDAGDQQNAINQLAYYIKAGLVKVPELYSGFEVKSDADLQSMAAQMLQGLDGTAVMTEDEIVIKD
tara:strand:- start:475 stop:1407 length:933 start_codon:yes stop_codon:yes gene_type:complete